MKEQLDINLTPYTLRAQLSKALARRTSRGVEYLHMPDGGSPESGSPHPASSEQVSPDLPKTLIDVSHQPITHEEREAALGQIKNPANQQMLGEMLEKGVAGGAPSWDEFKNRIRGKKDDDGEPIGDHDSSIEHTASDRTEGDLSQEELDRRRAEEATAEEARRQQEAEGPSLPITPLEPAPGGGGSEIPPVAPIALATPDPEERTPTDEAAPSPEWLTSPERGRRIVNEINRLETTLSYDDRYQEMKGPLSITNQEIYNEENGTYLDQLYKDLQDYTRNLRRVRNQKDIWNPVIAYRKIKRALERLARGEPAEDSQQARIGQGRERGERPPVLPTEPLSALFEKYDDLTNADVVEGDLATYFQEARALGLLDRADAIFTSTYRQIVQGGIPADQVEEMLEKNTDLARRAIEGAFRVHRTNPSVVNLQKIAEAYTTRTADVFQLILSGEAYNPIEGEFRFDAGDLDDEDTETYWRPGHYPKMYEIIAKTMRQFSKAKDSFLRVITRGSLGKSPDELYEHFNNFTEKFSQTASAESIDDTYIMESRLELGGRGFVFGGDYSFETYNMKSANQFLMAMALHEGPQRWVRVARSGNGGVGANLWKFDYDPRVVLLHNPGGSRGQLLKDTVTQHYLHAQLRDILIEESMGVVLKDYNPEDEESIRYSPTSIRVLNSPEAEQEREHSLKANLERIGIQQKEEEFKNMYEGFEKGDAHLINYQRYRDLNENQLRQLSPSLRRSVIVGKVQFMLRGNEGKNRKQLFGAIDNLIAEGQLNARDKRLWEETYDQSKANFDVAFQMVGAMGEKARRGGGVFFVDRKDEHGRRFVDNVPVYLAEKWVQYFVTRCKIEYSDESTFWNQHNFSENPIAREIIEKNKEEYKKAVKENKKVDEEDKHGLKNFKAQYRTAMVAKRLKEAVIQFKQNGFQSKIELPKLKFNTESNSPNFGDVIGTEGTETIDFDTAVKSIFSRWTNHTYWSYQPENRHMLTNPDVFKAAKKIRAGISRPEDEDNLAAFLLLVDPTLKRVAGLEDTQVREGESAMQQEIILFDGAVEGSNQGHWTIARELNGAFMPEDGNPFKMRTGYNLEDYSGIARFIIRMRQFVASNPKRFARRYAAEIANLPVNVSSMPDQWGQEGVLGAIEMFADPIGDMAEQKEASQFAITKWVEQMRIGNMLFGALVGQVDSERGFSIEGLFEKPTNNSDKLIQIWDKLITHGTKQEEVENEFFYAVMESFDRLWTVLKLVRTMESDTRNAQAALDLEKIDIFLADGKVNPEIGLDRNTGSSRHTERIFFNKYIDWLLSDKEGGGQKAYPSEVKVYSFLKEKYFHVDASGTKQEDGRTWADWLFDKMSR